MAKATATGKVNVVSLTNRYQQMVLKNGETLHLMVGEEGTEISANEVSEMMEKSAKFGKIRIEKVKGGEV